MTDEKLWKFLISLTVAFPAIAGLIRFRKINSNYYPFLFYIFVSLLNELLVGLVLNHYSKETRTINWQLFNLFEGTILLIQFYYWKLFERNKTLFLIVLSILTAGWIIENFIFSTIHAFNPVYLISCSFIIVLLSIQNINHIIVNQNQSPLTRNAMFIICVALVVYFIYNIFVFTLMAKGINGMGKAFKLQVFEIKVYINALTNLLFGLAVCLIPGKMPGNDFFKEPDPNR